MYISNYRRMTTSATTNNSSTDEFNDFMNNFVTSGSKSTSYRSIITAITLSLIDHPDTVQRAKQKYIVEKSWSNFGLYFRRMLVKEPIKCFEYSPQDIIEFVKLCKEILSDDTTAAKYVASANQNDFSNQHLLDLRQLLENAMLDAASREYADEISSHRILVNHTDLRIPHEWYPLARLTKRKIIYHGGPTNSGKTYHALQRLMNADPKLGGGIYCGPLRLLALEVYEKLNRQGVYCNLATGQEKKTIPFATHVSCTIELANVSVPYDIAVIDEIQMIGDADRGYAWTRAVLGLNAREIHVCGGMEALNIVKQLAQNTGDDFEINSYDRLSKLE
jgi:hypothetical protein